LNALAKRLIGRFRSSPRHSAAGRPEARHAVLMGTRFHLLGTIEARVDDRVLEVGHLRQWCVLTVLLLDANRAVPVDELVDRVWGEGAPQRARETLYGYLSRLRSALAPAGDVRITRRPAG
jgi:DNA-binding SARP family transcriptional activator